MKVIFLDIDGVLNTREFLEKNIPVMPMFNGWGYAIDPRAVERLGAAIRATAASVVLSSTWRLFVPLMDLEVFLRAYGCPARIIDKTPLLSTFGREREVETWLKEHPEISRFVILDDQNVFPTLTRRLIQVDPKTGLTWRDVDKLVEALGYDGPAGEGTV